MCFLLARRWSQTYLSCLLLNALCLYGTVHFKTLCLQPRSLCGSRAKRRSTQRSRRRSKVSQPPTERTFRSRSWMWPVTRYNDACTRSSTWQRRTHWCQTSTSWCIQERRQKLISEIYLFSITSTLVLCVLNLFFCLYGFFIGCDCELKINIFVLEISLINDIYISLYCVRFFFFKYGGVPIPHDSYGRIPLCTKYRISMWY